MFDTELVKAIMMIATLLGGFVAMSRYRPETLTPPRRTKSRSITSSCTMSAVWSSSNAAPT